jgi:hypothetical protein
LGFVNGFQTVGGFPDDLQIRILCQCYTDETPKWFVIIDHENPDWWLTLQHRIQANAEQTAIGCVGAIMTK